MIVGAGTAGCVLANRLSADRGCRVLLIEAGGRNRNLWIRIPVGYFRTIGNPVHDWCYRTEPEPNLNGRRLDWPRGRGLGGSSAVNGLIYVRGQKEDYDLWGRVASGWSFTDVLPWFKRAERQERGADEWHGGDGPIGVSDGRARFRVTDLFREAALNFGLPDNPDCNGASQMGVGCYQTTTWNGWRVSGAHGYLDPVRGRPNLHIVTDAHVTGVLISDGRAQGVRYIRPDGSTGEACAHGEVLLSAGTIGSAQILMLSGLGPAAHLASVGVTPTLDSPGIGDGLQDHLKFHNAYWVSIPTLNTSLNSLGGKALMLLEFALRRRGPLTMGAAPVFAFLKSAPEVDRPDIQFNVLPWSSDDPTKGFDPFPGFAVSICPLRPRSRGWIRLASADPLAPPRICANYLAEPEDRRVIVAGLKRAQEICHTEPLRDVIVEAIWPGRNLVGAPDEKLLDAIRDRVTTLYHPVGSVAMGDDSATPIDARCRLRGIDGLRVVDASVMPTIVSGNTNAAVGMIAEKASDMIRADRRARRPSRAAA